MPRPLEIAAEYDDLFVFAPSFVVVRDGLIEGKSVGTAPEVDLLFLDLDKTISAAMDPETFAKERKGGATVGKRRLDQVKDRVNAELLRIVLRHDSGKSTLAEFRRDAVSLMKVAWRDVFHAGVRSTGIRGVGSGRKGTLVKLEPEDEAWLRSAMKHEMSFLNGMIQAVDEGTYKMPLDKRVAMYVRTLESFYDSARVMGLPATVTIRWTGANDERTCVGCRYLFQHSPYTKKTLPTTPRAGLTPCLSNCRDRLVIRQATPEEVIRVTGESRYTRGGHVKNLRKLKAKGTL